MWDPFISAVRSHFERAEELIAFDIFHVSGHFGKALNKERAAEYREQLCFTWVDSI
jgi:transposase